MDPPPPPLKKKSNEFLLLQVFSYEVFTIIRIHPQNFYRKLSISTPNINNNITLCIAKVLILILIGKI